MLSIVPLINGGGCSRPVQAARLQSMCSSSSKRTISAGTVSANSSRWPRASSTLHSEQETPRAQILADTLDRATGTYLNEDKSPTRGVGGIDNRGSHFYLALFWHKKLAKQREDLELAAAFESLAAELAANEQAIVGELISVQGSPVDIGGTTNRPRSSQKSVMRPSKTLNEGASRDPLVAVAYRLPILGFGPGASLARRVPWTQ